MEAWLESGPCLVLAKSPNMPTLGDMHEMVYMPLLCEVAWVPPLLFLYARGLVLVWMNGVAVEVVV